VIAGLQCALVSGWAQAPQAIPALSPRRLALLLGVVLLAASWRPEQFCIREPMPRARAAVAKLVADAPRIRETFAARNEFLPNTTDRMPGPRGDGPLVEPAPGVTASPLPGHGSHHILMDVDVKAPADLVINQLYFPGWTVHVGDHALSPVDLSAALKPDGRLRVHLDPANGPRQRLDARYDGPPHLGLRWLGIGVAAALLLALARLDRRRAALPRA
jgi:hypothetical protein